MRKPVKSRWTNYLNITALAHWWRGFHQAPAVSYPDHLTQSLDASVKSHLPPYICSWRGLGGDLLSALRRAWRLSSSKALCSATSVITAVRDQEMQIAPLRGGKCQTVGWCQRRQSWQRDFSDEIREEEEEEQKQKQTSKADVFFVLFLLCFIFFSHLQSH